MNEEIDTNEALKRIDQYLQEVNELLKIKYNQGSDRTSELDTKIEGFIRATFKDINKKLRDYRSGFFITALGYEPSEEEKQNEYTYSLKKIKNHLLAFKEEIEMIRDSKNQKSKLDKIVVEIEEIKAEAERRGAVVDEKRWGAVIELIQMQRDELKRRGVLNQEILTIKNDIEDIKLKLSNIIEILKNKQ